MPATGAERSVYQRMLGARFDQLDERLQRYFAPPPSGMRGVGRGVYEVAGSRVTLLKPALAWLGWRRILFAEYGEQVPFTIINTTDAAGTLSAHRTFDFPGRDRVMEDTMSVIDGRLVDRLGKRRGLEVQLAVGVHDGGLTMTSGGFRLHVGRLRIPLPRVATMTLSERTSQADPARQRVDVRITAPLFGEVFRYTGTFRYEYEPLPR